MDAARPSEIDAAKAALAAAQAAYDKGRVGPQPEDIAAADAAGASVTAAPTAARAAMTSFMRRNPTPAARGNIRLGS